MILKEESLSRQPTPCFLLQPPLRVLRKQNPMFLLFSDVAVAAVAAADVAAAAAVVVAAAVAVAVAAPLLSTTGAVAASHVAVAVSVGVVAVFVHNLPVLFSTVIKMDANRTGVVLLESVCSFRFAMQQYYQHVWVLSFSWLVLRAIGKHRLLRLFGWSRIRSILQWFVNFEPLHPPSWKWLAGQ